MLDEPDYETGVHEITDIIQLSRSNNTCGANPFKISDFIGMHEYSVYIYF